jgi:hypothetical protein
MVNHPNRSRGPYTATVDTMSGWPSRAQFPTIRECRRWAEEHGRVDADRCVIEDKAGRIVAIHMRDQSGDGMRWFRAQV